MEAELRQKIYDMHGTVQKLDEKVDAVDEKLDRIDSDVEDIEQEVEKVEKKASNNRRNLAIIGGIATLLSTSAIILSQLFGGVLS